MLDLARLGFVIDTGPLEKLNKTLGETKSKSKEVEGAADGFENKWSSALMRLQSLAQRAAGALGLAFGAMAVVGMVDQWSDLQARVGNAIGEMEKAPAVLSRISDIARQSYSDLSLTAEGFIANRQALADFGLALEDQLNYTEALNNALVISGAKGEYAQRVQDALAKAMATGKLSGDGLITVLDRGDRVALALAKTLGTTVTGLRKMGAEGKITSAVIAKTLLGSMEELRAEAAEMPATIGDGMTLIKNAVLQTIGTFDQFLGLSGSIAEALTFVADNFQRVAIYATSAAVVMGGAWVVGWLAAGGAVTAVNLALNLFRLALARSGIGLIIVLVGELAYQFLQLVKSTGSVGDALKAVWELAGLTWQAIIDSAAAIPPGLNAIWQKAKAEFYLFVADLQMRWFSFLNSIGNALASIGINENAFGKAAEKVGESYMETMDKVDEANAKVSENMDKVKSAISEAWGPVNKKWTELKDGIAAAGDAADNAGGSLDRLNDSLGGGKGKKDKKGGGKDKIDEATKKIKELQKELDKLTATYGMNELAAAIWEAQQDAGVKATSLQGKQIEDLMTKIDALKTKHQELKDANQRAAEATQTMAQSMTGLFQSAFQGAGKLKDALVGLLGQLGQMMLNKAFMSLLGGVGAGGQSGGWFFNLMKSLPSFEGGGSTGNGSRSGGVDGKGGMLALLHPKERVYDDHLGTGPAGGGGGALSIKVGVDVDSSGNLTPFVTKVVGQGIASYDRRASQRTKKTLKDPKKNG